MILDTGIRGMLSVGLAGGALEISAPAIAALLAEKLVETNAYGDHRHQQNCDESNLGDWIIQAPADFPNST